MQVVVEQQDLQGQVVRLRRPTMTSKQTSTCRILDRSSHRDVETRLPNARENTQPWIDTSIWPAFEELRNDIRRNLQETSNAPR